MIANVFYGFRLFFFCLFLLLYGFILDYVFLCQGIGLLFLFVTFLYIFSMFFGLLSKRKCYQKRLSYNLVIIFLTIYFILLIWRLVFEQGLLATSPLLNLAYCKSNFIIMSCVMLGIVLNTFLLYLTDEEKV